MTLRVLYEGRKVFYDAKGYACVWTGGKSRKVHVLVWEAANGPKPPGHEIHHRDENKSNWQLDNLQLLTHIEHQRLHAGWVKAGDEWIAKPCTTCGVVKPLSKFYPRARTPSAKCKPCHNASSVVWAANNREKRRAISLAYYYRTARTARASRS